jgi:hypothetical protein
MANTETPKPPRAAKTAAEKAAGATVEAAASAEAATKDVTDAAFAYPKFEVPEMFRSFTEQGLTQTREAYARMKAAAEEATDLFEESFETAREGVREVQFKALDVVKENTDAALELVRKLLTATSIADAASCRPPSRASASRRWSTIPRMCRRPGARSAPRRPSRQRPCSTRR